MELVETVLGEYAVVADTLDLEELVVDPIGGGAELVEVADGFSDVEVHRIVDRGFGSQSAAFLEVLLDVRVLVLDVQAGIDSVGDDTGAVAEARSWSAPGQSRRKEQADACGAPQIEVVADDFFEEVAALDGAVEYLSQAHLELPDRESVIEAGASIGVRHGPRQPMRPAVEEGLNVAGAEPIADLLKSIGLCARQEPVVQGLEANTFSPELLLDPLVTVQAKLDRIGDIRPDLEERSKRARWLLAMSSLR